MSFDKEESHTTALSNSIADTMIPSTSSSVSDASSNFWDTLLLQQQCLLDLIYKTVNKSSEISSQDLHHESDPAAASLLPLTFHDLLVTDPTTYASSYIIKDDVFFAQPSVANTDMDDNASLSSRSSLSSIQQVDTSPCLSPVTSPTIFLYDHEPLFGTNETMGMVNDSQEDESFDHTSECYFLTSEMLKHFPTDEGCNIMPASFEPTVDDANDELSSRSSESGMCHNVQLQIPATSSKRRYITENQFLSTNKTPSAGTQKKNKEMAKKKKHDHTFMPDPRDITLNQISTSKECDKLARDNKTMFQQLTDGGNNWCRYCGTTEGVNWRPGPWGKNTLCNKHGCNYKGYGLVNRMPILDLSAFSGEKIDDRIRPIVQEFCIVCQRQEQTDPNQLIYCQGGCSRAYHQKCHPPLAKVDTAIPWYCSKLCKENRKLKKVAAELPSKHRPYKYSQAQKSIKK